MYVVGRKEACADQTNLNGFDFTEDDIFFTECKDLYNLKHYKIEENSSVKCGNRTIF